MKKITKIASVAMAAVMMFSAVPFTTASAATTKKVVNSANVSSGIKLSWKKTSKAKKYTVYRSTSKTKGYKLLGKTKKLTFTDKKAKGGKTYYYKVKASTGASYKVEKAVRLNAPTIKTIKANDESIKLTWSAVKGAKSYCVYSYLEGFGYICIDEVKKTTYNDNMIYEDGTYKYKVSAVSGDSESVKSAYKKVKYEAPLDAPSMTLAYINQDRTGMKIVFNEMDNAAGYRLYRSTDDGKNFDLLKDIKKDEVTKADGIFAKLEKFIASIMEATMEEAMGDLSSEVISSSGMGLSFCQYIDTDVTYGTKYLYAIEWYTDKKTSKRENIGVATEFTEADKEIAVGETSDLLKDSLEIPKELLGDEDILSEGLLNSIYKEVMNFFDIKLEAEDPEIISIDENNKVTGLKAGKTNVIQTLSIDIEGMVISFTAKIVVKVNEAVAPSEPASSEPAESTPASSETPSENPSEGTQEPSETPSENPSEGAQEPSESEATTSTTATTVHVDTWEDLFPNTPKPEN